MSAFSPTGDSDQHAFSSEKTHNIGHGLTPSKLFEVALRALNTSCLERKPPNQTDEAYLREIAGDQVSPIDELACQVIRAELQKLRSTNKAPVAAEETTSDKHTEHTA